MAHCEGQIFQKQSRLIKRGQTHHHLLNAVLIMRIWDKKKKGGKENSRSKNPDRNICHNLLPESTTDGHWWTYCFSQLERSEM